MRARFVLLALAACLCCWACAGPRVVDTPESTSPYDQIPPAAAAEFQAARQRFTQGDVAIARATFERLVETWPDSVVVGIWWQECEAALDDVEELRRRSEEKAQNRPSVASEVLAARAQTDPAGAEVWLARAEARDPGCVWVHYGRAFRAAGESRFEPAREALQRALASDPGHLASRRLEAWILARDGATDEARARLAGWVARAASDPRVLPVQLAEARLDLALLELSSGEPSRAEDQLEELDAALVPAWRFHAARACTRQASGDLEGARADIEAARALAPSELLPAVQDALFHDDFDADPARARAAWTAVREMAASHDDLSAAFETLRARVRLERLERRAANAAGSTP